MANENKLSAPKKPAEPMLGGESWQPFWALRKEVERLFEDFGAPMRSLATLDRMSKPFAVDVTENERGYEITAELPGMDEKHIEVNVANDGLTIRGEKKEETDDNRKGAHVSERRYGAFERYFSLPEGVDVAKISATFKNGVLKIALPKTAEAQTPARKIEVKSA